MNNNSDQKESTELSVNSSNEESKVTNSSGIQLSVLWENMLRFGLGDSVLRIGTAVISLLLIGVVITVMVRLDIGKNTSVALTDTTPTTEVEMVVQRVYWSTEVRVVSKCKREGNPWNHPDALLPTCFL